LVVADYLQEAAGHHAAELGVSMQALLEEGRAWVLAHLRLDVDRLPRWEEDVVVETWPSGLDRLYATREFILYAGGREEGAGKETEASREEIARGTSAWLVIDAERRRPLRPPQMLRSLETPDRPPALDADPRPSRSVGLPPHSSGDAPAEAEPVDSDADLLAAWSERAGGDRTFTVRYHDLDLNRHVNNVRYLEWALETLPSSVLDDRRCTSLSLQFQSEATLGDPVRSLAVLTGGEKAADGRLTAHHHLAHAETAAPLATATTVWA
jgi:acyl-ACP thioesterase